MRWLVLGCFLAVLSAVLSATVSDGKPSLFVMARSSVYNIGEKKAIYCKGLNLPQSLEWYSPSGELIGVRSSQNTRFYVEKTKNDSLEASIKPLIFVSLMIEDSGNWTCKAGDELSESIEIFVGEKVQMDVKEEDVVADEEKSAKLTCVAKGTPEPLVQWYRDISVLEVDPEKHFISKKGSRHMLEIKHLSHLDPGTYMCRATQEKLSYFVDKIFHLYVNHAPLFHPTTAQEREVYAIMSEIKNITCRAIAYPPPKYTWSKKNKDGFYQRITDEDMVYTAEDSSYSVLMLKVFNETDLGQYKCSVSNPRGHQQIIFDVSLGNKPNPPTAVSVYDAQPHNITFNVTCDNCTFDREDGIDPMPDNLPVIGYKFQLVPCEEGYAAPYWANASDYVLDIVNSSVTLFTVDNLINGTKYHARVATRNSAGLSEWLLILPNPETTNHASSLSAYLVVLTTAIAAALSY